MRKMSPVCQFEIQFRKVTPEQMTSPLKALLFIYFLVTLSTKVVVVIVVDTYFLKYVLLTFH